MNLLRCNCRDKETVETVSDPFVRQSTVLKHGANEISLAPRFSGVMLEGRNVRAVSTAFPWGHEETVETVSNPAGVPITALKRGANEIGRRNSRTVLTAYCQ
jgi:hypothetical protein